MSILFTAIRDLGRLFYRVIMCLIFYRAMKILLYIIVAKRIFLIVVNRLTHGKNLEKKCVD